MEQKWFRWSRKKSLEKWEVQELQRRLCHCICLCGREGNAAEDYVKLSSRSIILNKRLWVKTTKN